MAAQENNFQYHLKSLLENPDVKLYDYSFLINHPDFHYGTAKSSSLYLRFYVNQLAIIEPQQREQIFLQLERDISLLLKRTNGSFMSRAETKNSDFTNPTYSIDYVISFENYEEFIAGTEELALHKLNKEFTSILESKLLE